MNAIQRNFTMNVWTITTACSVNQSKHHKNLICHTVTYCDVSPLLIWEYLFFWAMARFAITCVFGLNFIVDCGFRKVI